MDITVFFKTTLDNQARTIELLEQLVAAQGGEAKKPAAAAGKKPAAGKKVSITKSQATAAVTKVKETLGAPAAREVLQACGVAKLAEMAEDNYEAVYAAANKALEDAASPEEESNDDDI